VGGYGARVGNARSLHPRKRYTYDAGLVKRERTRWRNVLPTEDAGHFEGVIRGEENVRAQLTGSALMSARTAGSFRRFTEPHREGVYI